MSMASIIIIPSQFFRHPVLVCRKWKNHQFRYSERKGEDGKRLWRGGPMSADFDIEDCAKLLSQSQQIYCAKCKSGQALFLYHRFHLHTRHFTYLNFR